MSKNAFHGGHLLLSDQYGMVSVMKDAVISGQDAFHLLASDVILYFLLEITYVGILNFSFTNTAFILFSSHFQGEDIPKTLCVYTGK